MSLFRSLAAPMLATLLAALPVSVHAQEGALEVHIDIPTEFSVRFGIAAGPDFIPAALRTETMTPQGPAAGIGGGVRVSVGRVGPLSIESRLALHSGSDIAVANPNEPGYPTLMLLWEEPHVSAGPQASWDVRLRVDPVTDAPAGPTFTVGGGLMTEGVRYLAGSTVHFWHESPLGLELEVTAYRIPWKRVELHYAAIGESTGDPVLFDFDHRETTYSKRWSLGFGLRVVYAMDLWGGAPTGK